MPDWILLIPVAFIWFVLYWIVGGVVFSLAALFRVVKLRKAQFSCLFTLAAMGAAYGATHTAYLFGKTEITSCVAQAQDFFEELASVVACGIFSIVLMGIVWFLGLLVVGSILLFLSRAKNQSWVDEKLDESNVEPLTQINNSHVH